MSIAAATRYVRARQLADNPQGQMTAAPPSQDTVLGQLTAFVPADIIVLWSGVQGFLLAAIADKVTTTVKVVLVAVGVIVVALALFLDFALGDKKAREATPPGDPVTGDRKVKTLVIVVIAFVLWNLCGPASPLTGGIAIGAAFAAAMLFSFFAKKLAELWSLSIPK